MVPGWRYEAVNRSAIELRYRLLPYIYNVMLQAATTGVPAMRPLFLDFPEDERTAKVDDEFLFGDDLLVGPVLWEEADRRDVYLPAGEWFDYWTGKKFVGNATIQVPVTMASIPLFVRGGGFIFRQPVVQHTGEMAGQPLQVLVAPAVASTGSHYEDDGQTMAYRQGAFMRRTFRQALDEKSWTVEVSAPVGTYRPAKRDLILETWLEREPKAVAAADTKPDETLPHLSRAELVKAARGWAWADGMMTIKEDDQFEAAWFVVEF